MNLLLNSLSSTTKLSMVRILGLNSNRYAQNKTIRKLAGVDHCLYLWNKNRRYFRLL